MRTERNDPCPCGSGKKYKACCMEADRLAGRAARGVEVWEVDVAPLGVVAAEGTAPALVLVVAGGTPIHSEVLDRLPRVRERARAVVRGVQAAAEAAGRFPARVHARDAELAAALRPELARDGVQVAVAPLPALDAVLDFAREHLRDGDAPPPPYATAVESWRATGASPAELADFHRAAAAYHRAMPEGALPDFDLLELSFPDGTEWAASLMGVGEAGVGLVLYSEPDDLLALLEERHPPAEHFDRMRGVALTVSYEPRDGLPRAMRREVVAAGWEVAGPGAYPALLGLHLPGNQVTAEHVRTVALALRALACAACGEDPESATGVRVTAVDLDDAAFPWRVPEEAAPICAEGPGAEPAAALRGWEAGDEVRRAERDRLARMRAWLEEAGLARGVLKRHLGNAEHWTCFLEHRALPAGAVTEYDLRLFVYDHYPRKAHAKEAEARALPESLAHVVRFLEEREGVRYPFAATVLEELEAAARIAAEEHTTLDDVLDDAGSVVYPYLDARGMLHDYEVPGTEAGWPDLMDMDVAVLEHELQRRWLLWYDEAVRGGIVDPEALAQVLVGRQREWENTPHPAHPGRTPADVLRAYRAPLAPRAEA